ncbi:hypothetical protein PCE1_000350 [Barthelona sp. PCE]
MFSIKRYRPSQIATENDSTGGFKQQATESSSKHTDSGQTFNKQQKQRAKKRKNSDKTLSFKVPEFISPIDLSNVTDTSLHEFNFPDFVTKGLESLRISSLYPFQTFLTRELSNFDSKYWDMCVAAPTGSGKTLSFCIPIVLDLLDRIGENPIGESKLHSLIVVPSHELVSQITMVLRLILPETHIVATLLGSASRKVERALLNHASIVVSSPGRLVSHLEDGIDLSNIRYIVLDECDNLLRNHYSGFVVKLARLLPDEGSTLLLSSKPQYRFIFSSASFTHKELSNLPFTLNDPAIIGLTGSGNKFATPTTLSEYKLHCEMEDRGETLVRLLNKFISDKGAIIVFVSDKDIAQDVNDYLVEHNIKSHFIGGQLTSNERLALTAAFGVSFPVLVSTDIAARGIDLRVSHVVNYSLPNTKQYLHRAGRTARAGRKGMVVTLISSLAEKKSFKSMIHNLDNRYVRTFFFRKRDSFLSSSSDSDNEEMEEMLSDEEKIKRLPALKAEDTLPEIVPEVEEEEEDSDVSDLSN